MDRALIRRRASIPLAALLPLLTACPSRDATPPRPSASPSAEPTGPATGEIRVAYPWEPATLNPFVRGGDAPATREIVRAVMPAMFRSIPGGRVEPWLVERVVAESPTEVRLALRDDAVWSDGTPITAADVAFTWRTIMDPKAPVASRAGYDALAGVDAPEPKLVVYRFARPHPAWRDLFAAGLGVLPEHALRGKALGTVLGDAWPVSGGPFVLARYTRGLEAVLEASPKPWGPRARVARIRIQFVPDSTTALQMLRAGRTDVLGPYSSPDFARRARDAGGSVTTDVGATWAGLALRADTAPLTDARVRRGLALATDRERFVRGLVREEGEALRVPFAEPRVDGAGIPYDVTAAAEAFDAAGFGERRGGVRRRGTTELTVTLASVHGDDLSARLVRALFGPLADAGVNVAIVDLEYEQLWRDWLPSARFRAAVVRFADPPGGALRDRYGSANAYPAGVNYARIADPALDAVLGDPAAAAPKLAELAPVVPLYRVRVPAVARAGVGGVRANASADGFFTSANEWSVAG